MRKYLSGVASSVASFLFVFAFVAVSSAEEANSPITLRVELTGTWILVKDLVLDSKGEVEPSLRKLSFGTNETVRWWYEIGGKPEQHSGRFVILLSPTTRLSNVTITEDVKADSPTSSRPITFIMEGVTVDLDSRFNAQTVGKVLKFSHRDGKKYVFTRQQNE